MTEAATTAAEWVPIPFDPGSAVADTPIRIRLVGGTTASGSIDEARRRVHHADIAEFRRLVDDFAARAERLDREAEIWVSYGQSDDLRITVVTPRDELDHELALHAILIELAGEFRDPSIGDLTIRTPAEVERLDRLSLGERLR